MSRPEIQVVINNSEVDTATIIDVFAYNKAGLLYQILKKVFELNLDVTKEFLEPKEKTETV